MADVPVPRTKLTATPVDAVGRPPVPGPVLALMETLWAGGQSAYVVGGSLRDAVLGREPYDWDLATNALPDRIQELFPTAVYENRFGTVGVQRGGVDYQITTLRSDHEYADHRRPHHVEFTDSIEADLGRRDFTVNAMAWGAPAPVGNAPPQPVLIDPFGGGRDARARTLRAVGDPDQRFEEDALRMIRAVRLAATLGFTIESGTLAAIARQATLASHLSGERIAAELERLLAADRPSVGLRLMEETGLLAVIAPDLATQRGVLQNKVAGEDLWDHTIRTVDAAPSNRPVVRLAALLHDLGKPQTATDGHFHGHELVGADMAKRFLLTLRMPRSTIERVADLIASHMFSYEPSWSDAAVRRFITKIGAPAIDELFELREADNAGSGIPRDSGLTEIRQRITEQLEAHVALTLKDLTVNGDDLIRELHLAPGPQLGRVLNDLLDAVIADSDLNDGPTLMMLAQSMLESES